MERAGRVEVVCGPMFAGKTEELLRRVRRAVIAGRRVVVIGHALDTRFARDRLASHAGLDYPSTAVADAGGIEALVPDGTDVVAIDEAQFFGSGLLPVVERLAGRGLLVIVAGLAVTFDGRPFEPLPSLMALAERVDKLTAICSVCGEEAVFHVKVAAAASGERPAIADALVAIDEAQFFGSGLVPVVERLAGRGLLVIVAGLAVTFDGRPFEPLPSLMALAERVDKLTAICSVCGEEAVFHVKVAAAASGERPAIADALVAANVGGAEAYQARCRRHGPRPAAEAADA